MTASVTIHPKSSGMSFSPYHLKAILYLVFTDEEYRDKFYNILKPEHFILDKNLYTLAKGYWNFTARYGKPPSVTDFVEEVFVQKGKNIDLFITPPSEEYMEMLLELFLSFNEIEADPTYISDITTNIIKLSSIHRILSNYKSEIAMGTVNVDELANEIVQSTQLLNPVDLGINALDNLEKRTELRQTIDVLETVVPIGIPGISEFIEDGGLPRGTLGFFMAPPGVGKTTAMITLSKVALLHNKKVLYISAELSLDVIMKRFDAAFTGIPISDVRAEAVKVRNLLTKNQMYKRAISNLRVIEVPIGSTTVRDIDAMLAQLDRKGWAPDMIAVDYADNLICSTKQDNSYRESHSIYKDLRKLAQERKCVVWTASQVNSEGIAAAESNKSDAGMSLKHAAESRAKTHVSDLIIGVARTKEERERNEARLVILKNRFGGNEMAVVTVFPQFDISLLWTSTAKPPKVYASISDAVAENFNSPSEENEITNETRALLYSAESIDNPVEEPE